MKNQITPFTLLLEENQQLSMIQGFRENTFQRVNTQPGSAVWCMGPKRKEMVKLLLQKHQIIAQSAKNLFANVALLPKVKLRSICLILLSSC